MRPLVIRLRAKAALGKWDRRYCEYYGVPQPTNIHVKRFITRGYALGLVPTATTNGRHAAHSLHYLHRAADMGLRKNEIGTAVGDRRRRRFQRSEYRRAHRVGGYTELLGPINDNCYLNGHPVTLAEGSPLEQAHDNHVHGGF